jgi:hypothetical protein
LFLDIDFASSATLLEAEGCSSSKALNVSLRSALRTQHFVIWAEACSISQLSAISTLRQAFLTFYGPFDIIAKITLSPLNPYPWILESGLLFQEAGNRMRGDQIAWQRPVIRAIEARITSLTVSEVFKRDKTGIQTISRDLDALPLRAFPTFTERSDRIDRWTFIDNFRFRTPLLFLRKAAKFTGEKRFEFAYPKKILDSFFQSPLRLLERTLAFFGQYLGNWKSLCAEFQGHARLAL